jgi:Bacterial Ig-like domain
VSLPVTATVTTTPDSKTAVLDPTKDLLKGGTYCATLTGGLTDTAGNALAPYSWKFTVAKR